MTISDSAVETAAHWARCLIASAEQRLAAIETLATVAPHHPHASETLAEINDPTGIRLVSEARNRAWAHPGSEILGGK